MADESCVFTSDAYPNMVDYMSGFGLLTNTAVFFDQEDPRVRDLVKSSLVYFLSRRAKRGEWINPFWCQTLFPRFLGLISTVPAVGQPMLTLAVIMPTPQDIIVMALRHGPGLQAEARLLRQRFPHRLFQDSIPVRNYWFDYAKYISPSWSSRNEYLGWFNPKYNTTLLTLSNLLLNSHFSPAAVLVNAEIEDLSFNPSSKPPLGKEDEKLNNNNIPLYTISTDEDSDSHS